MNVRRSTARRVSRQKPVVPHPPQADLDGSELSVLATYQQQIAELEGVVTGLRQRLMERNASLSELMESRRRMNDLFQNAPVGYVVHDRTGMISEMNHTARKMLGFTVGPREVSLIHFVRQDQVSLCLDHLHRATTSASATTDVILRSQAGQFFPVQLVTLAFPVPQSSKVFRTILIDISQRRAAEAALGQTQQDYHLLIDTVEGIVWEADAHTLDVIFVSRYAERLLGFQLADWSRPGFWQNHIYIEDRERVANEIARAVARRQPLRLDYRVVAADRRVLWLHDNITTRERDGQLRLLGVAVDVTEQHETQERLRHSHELLEQRVSERTAELSSKVQELETFSYSISHDLRAPLRSMLGFTEVALSQGGDQLSAAVKECLRHVIQGGLRADRLIQDVLAYSRVSRANFQLVRVDLDTFVPNLVGQYPEFQSPQAAVQVQRPLLPVVAHEALLAQCVTNLLGNAVKFVRPSTVPQIKIWTERGQDAQAVRLWIEDNGIGIEPQHASRIFNMFERVHSARQYPGTGIGLAVVRKAGERMGGSVGVESEPGKGSRFWIQLKAA